MIEKKPISIATFNDIQPFVRMVKIKKAVHLKGVWEDFDHVLIYNMQGSLDWVIAGNRYHLEPNDLILIPPYMHHYANKTDDDELVQYIIHFDLYEDEQRMVVPHKSAFELEQRLPLPQREKLFDDRVYVATVPENDRIAFEKLFLCMYGEFFQRKKGFELMLKGCQMQMMSIIFRLFFGEDSKTSNSKLGKSSKTWKLVENALEYIYLHVGDQLDNNSISAAICVSPNYLSKLFQQYIGMSMHTYVLNYRVDRAARILASGKYNITETATQCGFSSIHSFSKAFKQLRGCSPSAYMDAMKENNMLVEESTDYDLHKQVFYNR